jgi:hypothetical protein
MAEKISVTVPFTNRQKELIKKATGRSVSGMKVEQSGSRTVLKSARIRLTRPRTPGTGFGFGEDLPRPFIK